MIHTVNEDGRANAPLGADRCDRSGLTQWSMPRSPRTNGCYTRRQDLLDAASARGCNGRLGGERDRLAASYRSRRLLGNLEEKAWAHSCFGQRRARPGLPHRRAGQPVNPSLHDASAPERRLEGHPRVRIMRAGPVEFVCLNPFQNAKIWRNWPDSWEVFAKSGVNPRIRLSRKINGLYVLNEIATPENWRKPWAFPSRARARGRKNSPRHHRDLLRRLGEFAKAHLWQAGTDLKARNNQSRR
jgi:hypothetical protein